MDEFMNENTEFSAEMLELMDDEYIHEKSDISTHILKGEGTDAHEKALALLKKDSENIDFIIFAIAGSASGDFFEDVIKYGNEALSWVHNNGKDLEKNNSLGWSTLDVREKIARSYFGLQDFSAAKNELDKMTEERGALPDDIKPFAIKTEYQLNGVESAFHLADQLTSTFVEKEGEEFFEFKLCEVQICFVEIKALANNNITDFPRNISVAQAQTMSKCLLRLVNSLESIDESQLSQDYKVIFEFGKDWLLKVALTLYDGSTVASEGKSEIKINNHYTAAKDCIITLEKLSDMNIGFAQFLLGEIYCHAYNVESDQAKAFYYYKNAYKNGVNGALVNLALYYDEGVVTEKDTKKALDYAKKATEEGDTRAYSVLGQIYADSLKDVEQGLIWLKKGYANGDEMAKNILLRLGRENVDNFDDKIQFILEINQKLDKDIHAMGTGPVSDMGRKYAGYYMEIEKYYIASEDRLKFINVCLNVQVDLVTAPEGIVSGDYFIDQFEKLIAENCEIASKIAKERGIASRISNLAFTEFIELMAAEKVNNKNDLNWGKIEDYYLPKALELGWDGYYADGSGPWEPNSHSDSSKSVTTADQSKKPESVAMNSYDRVSVSGSNSGGCYIATAVYGSYDCPEVWILRRFRDYSLEKKIRGRLFIKAYYAVSPVLVKLFGDTVWFQKFWKGRLDKIVQELRKKGYEDTPYCD